MKKNILLMTIAFLSLSLNLEAQLPHFNHSGFLSDNNPTAYLKVKSEELDRQNGQLSFNLIISFNDIVEFEELFNVQMEGDVFDPVIPNTMGGGGSQNYLTFSLTNK